ncbi:hypothetical protein [Achromobacter xylosoxidans]|uniref:Uncharacterized protein n=1 Tax=Alcaligenes xylosoxydans xylosoxydans TaxID=85698 RepID=A0A424W7P9_ALCXX|nr:hypothetical protein [Achromobacter xylosoxidans]MBC9907011.1 hypothetical protein [Achromobacter xylosoxidans]MBD0871678.1 hypothetical protein [Achromobacter xylosoxidans]QNP87586.1 hypothetical protein IAG39_08760 [Achromobacter xylosoxidans]RPJ89198.1 hypothetical protein DY367_24065 [Achromobacter xylosoxidans]
MKMRELALYALFASLLPALAGAAAPKEQPAAAPQAAQPTENIEQFDKKAAEARENLEKMQQQMNQIQKTSDPAERQKLLREHQALMQQTMGMMGQMWNGGAMGCCAADGGGRHHQGGPMMGWGAMRGNYSNQSPEQIRERQYMRDQYMGMQQRMMEQMMQQQLNGGAPNR